MLGKGWSALMRASAYGKLDVVKLLMKQDQIKVNLQALDGKQLLNHL